MKQAKSITTYLIASMFAILACAFAVPASAATSNTFVATDAYGATRVYSVDNVRMITASGGAFTLQYNDGNSSDPFADTSGSKLAAILLNAPALKNFKQVGASGVYISPDQIRKLQCQYGNGTPGIASATGDTLFGYWTPPGFVLLPDAGCATVNAIKANSN